MAVLPKDSYRPALYEGAGTGRVSFPTNILRSILELAETVERRQEMAYRLKIISLFEMATSGKTLIKKDLQPLRNSVLQQNSLNDKVQSECNEFVYPSTFEICYFI